MEKRTEMLASRHPELTRLHQGAAIPSRMRRTPGHIMRVSTVEQGGIP
jgi:hypothetical protein